MLDISLIPKIEGRPNPGMREAGKCKSLTTQSLGVLYAEHPMRRFQLEGACL